MGIKINYGLIFRNPASSDILLSSVGRRSSGWGRWILADRCGSATKKKQRKGERKRAGGFRTWSPVVVRETPLWRPGPTAKPVLCNACGIRWRTRGTLDDYLPKHASNEKQSHQLPSEMKPHLLARDDQKLEVGEEISGQDGSSACLEEEMIHISSLGSAGSSPDKCMQMEETNDKDPHLNPDSVPRRKISKLRHSILSPAQIQRTLDNNLQAPGFEIISDGDEPVTLIYARNKYIPPNEIGLGAMLLVSPTTTIERSTPQSAMAEDTVSCSMDVSK
uniref:GATA transcription factor 29 n=1 Tax=Solanum tuberosum TaxID=4113 RepID=M1DU47_SOLTU